MPGRILVIRGGAIGDFILTLPAIGLLRENLPETRIEILGYPGITQVGLGPKYADAVHSIEYAPLARFFSRRPTLDPEMVAFFASFQQIISYLYDPDGIFEQNLRAAGVKNLLQGPGKLGDSLHAVQQLAQPLEKMAFFIEETAPHFQPNETDLECAASVFNQFSEPFIAIHPGSGGAKKNWPLENWQKLVTHLQNLNQPILLVGGEADGERLSILQAQFNLPQAINLPLRTLGAVLGRSRLYIGHDSGVSHLAAATQVKCLLLFGPTDPEIWAPLNPQVTVLQAFNSKMENLAFETVKSAVNAFWARET